MSVFYRAVRIFMLFCAVVEVMSSDCFITVPPEPQSAPRLGQWFGRKWLKVPSVPSNHTKVNIYGTVYAKCAYGFSSKKYKWLEEIDSISIKCKDDRTFKIFKYHETNADEHYLDWDWNGFQFSCAAPKLQLYQFSEAFDCCSSDGESYYLTARLLTGQEHTLAYFCYDVESKKLRLIKYKSSPKDYTEVHDMITPNWNNTNATKVELEDFQRIFNHWSAAQELKTELGTNSWLRLANYLYAPVVQSGAYTHIFKNFSAAFDILWWPNLLHGNWPRFNEALEKQTSKVAYNLTTGTSGIAEIPHQNLLTGEMELKKFSFGSMNTTIPKYIWTFGKADDGRENFLVISYNSPFVDLENLEDIIFCEDICYQYEWLDEARATFSYWSMGLTFCCAVEEAIDGEDYIHSFQLKWINEGSNNALADNTTAT